jgi:hypothetical protein
MTVLAGENNEYRTIKVNAFKNILEHVQNLSITERPAWQPQATNSDSKSQKQCLIAEAVLDYYMNEKKVERYLKDAVTFALLFGEGVITTTWEPQNGPEDQTGEKSGDIEYNCHEPVDVIRNVNLKSFNKRDWLVVRTYENKYELAAKYPDYNDEIIAQKSGLTAKDHYLAGQFIDKSTDEDLIPVLTFYHTKTITLPEGRQMLLLTDGTALYDTQLLYPHLPCHRISPKDILSSPLGASVSFDLLPLQETLDSHYSTFLSVNENFAIPKVLLPTGSNINTDSLSQGFAVITYNEQAGKPSIMEMPTAPDGLFRAIENIVGQMETLSGVNSVTRGNPEASLKSGSALALVQSMAIQFNSPLQQSYIQLLEDVGTATLNILKTYAESPRIIQIIGKSKRGMQLEFTGEDISDINRVQVEAGNPMAKTISGRLSIAQDLLQNGLIKTADEYLMVLQTGSLDPLLSGKTSELLALKTENEKLMDREQVFVLFTDDHALHINEHSALASDPQVREDPELFSKISEHIVEHLSMLTDPNYALYRQVMGQPNLVAPAGPGGTGMPPNASPDQMGAGDVMNKAAEIKPPQAPVNPATNERNELPRSPT